MQLMSIDTMRDTCCIKSLGKQLVWGVHSLTVIQKVKAIAPSVHSVAVLALWAMKHVLYGFRFGLFKILSLATCSHTSGGQAAKLFGRVVEVTTIS